MAGFLAIETYIRSALQGIKHWRFIALVAVVFSENVETLLVWVWARIGSWFVSTWAP